MFERGKYLHDTILSRIDKHAKDLEQLFEADVLFFYGPINSMCMHDFRHQIEELSNTPRKRLAMFLNTPGGSVEVTEDMVNIMRHHYDEVYFVVADRAMSAGTILCMSGDKIFMDYSSSLGPIDPQVPVRQSDGSYQLVGALGYLDKVEELVNKSKSNTITPAEFALLQNLDLAMLRAYEQARDLSVNLLKTWLVMFKFKNWENHGSDPEKKGQPVTPEEKNKRANEIAKQLGDNKIWHSHGRSIDISTLQNKLNLKIEDYSTDESKRTHIRLYNNLLIEYVEREQYPFFVHTAPT